MSDDKKVIFSMSRVSKTYSSSNKTVLKDIYLSFFYGAKIGILGLNGAGKSTLLKVISGIIKPTKGKVVLNGSMAPLIELGAGFDIELTGKEVPVKIIGTRHGEKLYETLCTREEMQKAEDMGDFYRIPADNRDLNYAKYFSEGEEDMSKIEDYHSHNTEQQGVEGLKKLISKLPLIRKEVFGEDVLQYPM